MKQFSYIKTFLMAAVLCGLVLAQAQAAERGEDAQDINPISMQLNRAAPGDYEPDSELEIQITISANTSEGITAVGLYETPPDGWLYGEIRAITGDLPPVIKQDPGSGVIEFAWINPPQLPITFAYTLNVPAAGPESSGSKIISGQAEYRTDRGRLVTAPVITSLNGEDQVKPEISLQGENPLVLEEGQSFQEPGYTAHDDVDGDVTAQVKVGGSVDMSTPGTYELTYTVKDKAGNEASKTRTVRVKKKPEENTENPPVAGGVTNNPPPQNNPNRRRGVSSVAGAFDNFADEPEETTQDENKGEQDVLAQNSTTPAKHPNDTGQPSSPDKVGPKTTYSGPTQGVQVAPEEINAKDGKIAPAKATTVNALKEMAASEKKTPTDTKEKTDEALKKSDSEEVATAVLKVDQPKAEVVASNTDTSLPIVQDTASAAVTPVVSAPVAQSVPSVFVRISENLAKLTRQELMTLAGLGLAMLMLSMVAFVFWRGAYRPPMRR